MRRVGWLVSPVMIEREEPGRDLAGLVVPLAGRLVATGDRWEPCRLIDAGGASVRAASSYFGHLLAAGRSELTIRSYGMDLLRWFGFLWAAGLAWNHVVRSDARDLCRWLQVAGKPVLPHWREQGRPGCRAVGGGLGRGLFAVGARALRDGAAQLLRLSRGGRHRAAGQSVPAGPVTPGRAGSRP
jgi:hypothetical protein